MAEDEEFRAKIARAREDQSDYFMDECLKIADEAKPEDAQVAKLRVYVREKYAAKCKPKKWGDKPSDVTVNTHVHNHISVEKQREWQRRRQEALRRG